MGNPANWEAEAGKVQPPASSPREKLPLGTDLGPYRLISDLGTGGMGLLYIGEHRTIGRRMAIKVLNPDLAQRADIVRRFFDEARSVNTINHEHIVEIFDFVADPQGLNYLVMELLEGSDLQQSRVHDGPFALRRTLSILAQTGSALAAAHAKGIIHRDLKPENVFLTQRAGLRDFVKLLDFGLAKLSESMKQTEHLTRAGTVLGTPEYMSPEQARGTHVDARSDVYALGLLLHWMLLDRLPFDIRDFDKLQAQREKGPAHLPACNVAGEHLPPSLDTIVQRCLQPNPSRRFQSCTEVEQALRGVDPDDGKPAALFNDATVPVMKLAVIGGAPSSVGASHAPMPMPEAVTQRTERPPPKKRVHPPAVFETGEHKRFETPWLAMAIVGSLAMLGWAFYLSKPFSQRVLPNAPGSPYGAALMGPQPGVAASRPTPMVLPTILPTAPVVLAPLPPIPAVLVEAQPAPPKEPPRHEVRSHRGSKHRHNSEAAVSPER